MTTPRAELVIRGQVVVAAEPGGMETAETIGIAEGRVVSVGRDADVAEAAAPGARIIDVRGSAVVPGIHDFHIHLVGLARTRRAVLVDGLEPAELLAALRSADAERPPGAWLTGRGWSERQMSAVGPTALHEAVGKRAAFLTSHDGHSAWASRAALAIAGIGASTADPPGGRIERDGSGAPTGILRETALDLVASVTARLQGEELRAPLDETLGELASLGITGMTEAGDYTDENGIGADADLGDSFSSLTDLADLLDGRVRATLGIPADAIGAAERRGLRTGMALPGRRSLRFGWAKEYADGALGSGTAALFEPRTCGDGETGILRVSAEEFDAMFAEARRAGIGVAVHAIGDRAAAAVLDAVERATARHASQPADRMEHVQLIRADDAARLARLGITASIQPIHAAADRDLVEACWQGRQEHAYAWRTLAEHGALLAAGSDAPVEAVNPWLGIFAAVHGRTPDDARGDWRPEQRLGFTEALCAYTLGPARAIGVPDEGHLRVGGRADLAVLSCDLSTLTAADERLADVRAQMTFVDGVEVRLR